MKREKEEKDAPVKPWGHKGRKLALAHGGHFTRPRPGVPPSAVRTPNFWMILTFEKRVGLISCSVACAVLQNIGFRGQVFINLGGLITQGRGYFARTDPFHSGSSFNLV